MSAHLSSQEFVDALEGTLADPRQSHLSECEVCSRELAEFMGVARETRVAGEVPEPSPLFWDHFSARVRSATNNEPVRPLTWWERAWRPIVLSGALAAAAMLGFAIYNGPASPEAPAAPVDVAAAVEPEPVVDDESLELMVQLAADFSNEELQAVRPGRAATTAAIDDLTPEQQAEFIRLIKAEIGESQ